MVQSIKSLHMWVSNSWSVNWLIEYSCSCHVVLRSTCSRERRVDWQQINGTRDLIGWISVSVSGVCTEVNMEEEHLQRHSSKSAPIRGRRNQRSTEHRKLIINHPITSIFVLLSCVLIVVLIVLIVLLMLLNMSVRTEATWTSMSEV